MAWTLHIAYMQNMCILYLYASIYHFPRCTTLGCDQQIPRYVAVPGLLWVQLQGWVMGQPQLPNCCILYVICIVNCFHMVHGVLYGFVFKHIKMGYSLGSRHEQGRGENWLE